jgi:hypothetical protein
MEQELNQPDSSAQPQEMEVGTATVERISIGTPNPPNPNDVQFFVKYPKNWTGEKTMPEGSVQIVSRESADYFVSLKIGNIIQ